MATVPAGTSDRTAAGPQATPSALASFSARSAPTPSADEVMTNPQASPRTSRTASTSSASTVLGARSALVRTTATPAPQSRAITAERAILSHEIGVVPSCCTTSTTPTFAASVCRSPREPPFQRAMSLSRGRICRIRPISWPAGTRARTQSPTATRESPPLVRCAENSTRKSASSVTTAGNPRSSRTTHPSAISSTPQPSERAACVAASPKALRWRSDGVSSEKAGRSAREERAGRPCWDLPAL